MKSAAQSMTKTVDLRWWMKKDPWKQVKRLAEDYRRQQSGRRAKYKRWAELYGADIGAAGWAASQNDEELAFNALRNAADTLQSKLVQNQPLPLFTTEGGTYSEQRRAREKSRFVEGVFEEVRIGELAEIWSLEAIVCGTGICFGHERHGRVHLERVMPSEFIINESEARYGKPRTVFLRRPWDRGELCAVYPKFREQIEMAPEAKDDFFTDTNFKPDRIFVYESWHLPSGPNAKDGRYAACIDGATLESVPYTRERFPFAKYTLNTPLYGWFGPSKIAEGAPAQREFDFGMSKLQRSMKMMAHNHLLVPRGANVNEEAVDNEDGTIIEYDGQIPPTPLNMPGVSPQFYEYMRDMPNWMMQHMGISALSASQQKPAGITSGIALATLMDSESLRFMTAEKAWERFFIDIGNLCVDIARDIARKDPKFSARFTDGSTSRRIKWADVDKEDDPSVTRVFPISAMSKNPGLKLQQADSMFNSGAIDISTYKRLSGLPDLEASNELDTAATDVVDKLIDRMLLTGKRFLPEPTDDPDIIIDRGTKAINLARERDHDDAKIDVVRQYVAAAVKMKSPPPSPPGGPPGVPMQAGPATPPPVPPMPGQPPVPPAFQ